MYKNYVRNARFSLIFNNITQERRTPLGITLAQESSENNGRSKLCNSVNFV